MVVQHNLQAMNSNRMLGITQGTLAKSTEKLSSGYKVNRAADDAAGLSISEKMRKQIRGLTQASLNAEDGISSVQTAEGALTEVHDMLQRMNELAVKAANGTNSEGDRQTIQDEIKQLTTEIDRVAETTKFNETYLLKGGKNPYVKTLSAYDAGIKGTFVDAGGDKASLTVDLSVGKTISIAGKNYNIIEGGEEKNASDGIAKLQEDVKNAAEVTINGTIYTRNADGIYDTGAGTTYTADELAGKIIDGSTVKIGTADAITARDYNDNSNITAADAADLINKALTQANNIGASHTAASVITSDAPVGIAKIGDNGTTVTAKNDMVAYNATDKTFKEIKAGDDITEYAKAGSGYELYKAAGTNPIELDADDKNVKKVLVVHTADTSTNGVTEHDAKDAVAGTTTGIEADGTASTDYALYEKIDNLVAETTITGASHNAAATVSGTDLKINIEFTDVAGAADFETAKKIADGQNALLANMANVSFTAGDTQIDEDSDIAGAGKFSHGELNDNKLDIREDGTVYYDGTQIATIKGTATGDIAEGVSTALKVEDVVNAEAVEGGSSYTFDITKGTTEVAEDLTMNIHVGADADMTNKISIDIASMDAKGLGIYDLNVADDSGMAGTYAVDAIEKAIKTVSAQRSLLGAVQNRLEHTIKNLDNVVENTTSAESAIRDTDMASEMVKYSNNNILSQAGQSMLAQANQSNQGVLSLLG